MNQGVDTAVILAAGLGSRLGELKEDRPKAFIKIGEESLIERSIKLLISNGIAKIIIGTGFGSEYFDALSKTYPQITTCKNPEFANTGSMYTLYLLRQLVSAPFLLLEGDLLYEPAALSYLTEDKRENIILTSDATNSGDEVFIQKDNKGLLEQMSKQRTNLDHVSGELVGISKISLNALALMCHFAEGAYVKEEHGMHYEDALVGIAKSVDLYVKVVNDLAWCEIDDPSHLERAISVVYPRILKRA